MLKFSVKAAEIIAAEAKRDASIQGMSGSLGATWGEQKNAHKKIEAGADDWCAVFIDGALVFEDAAPDELIRLEAAASGHVLVPAVMKAFRDQYARMGIEMRVVHEHHPALDLRVTKKDVACHVFDRSAGRRGSVTFRFAKSDGRKNILAALATAADLIEAQNLAGLRKRAEGSHDDPKRDVLVSAIDVRMKEIAAEVDQLVKSCRMRFWPQIPRVVA